MTIKIKKVSALMEENGSPCDADLTCEPYIKLFINGKHVHTSAVGNSGVFFANINYESEKIAKTSTISIEVWDQDGGLNFRDDLLQRTQGNIDSFLSKPIREGYRSSANNGQQNYIETATFWLDEYKN